MTLTVAFVLGPALFVQCEVAIGTITSCSATTYTGTAAIDVDGRYRRCKIGNGRVYECGGWFSGTASAVDEDGRWRRCRISTGTVRICDGTGYTGTVVARVER